MWVLRDFLLALVDDDGAEISADEYMELQLAERPGYDAETAARNRTRRFFKAFFRDRHCFTLVRPVDDEAALQQLEELPASTLRREFIDGVAALRAHVLSHATPKQLSGRDVTGPMLVSLARSYVAAINRGGVPSIADAWEAAAGEGAAHAATAAFSGYARAMTPGGEGGLKALPLEDSVITAAADAALATAVAAFESAAPAAGGHAVERARAMLRSRADAHLQALRRDNAALSESSSRAALRRFCTAHIAPVVATVASEMHAITEVARALTADATRVRSGGDHAAPSATACADLATRARALPAPHLAQSQSSLLTAWSAVTSAFSSEATGPRAAHILATEGARAIAEAQSAAAAACDAAVAARDAALTAVMETCRVTAVDNAGAASRTAASLEVAQREASAAAMAAAEASAKVDTMREGTSVLSCLFRMRG